MTLASQPERFASSEAASLRQTASPALLLARALGPPRTWWGKLRRLASALRLTVDFREYRRRLGLLRARGLIETMPSRLQILVGGLDMLRYFIEPGARDYYRSRGIGFAFHNLLKVLDDPASVIDPIGIRSPRDTIIGHVLQVVHANPVYDLQLLEMFEDGVEEMERQTAAMAAGTHPRQVTIGAIVEDPEYHGRLLGYVRAYRADPFTPMLHRRARDARANPGFTLAECTFGTLDGAFRYFARLPRGLPALARHLRRERAINPAYCEPGIVEAHGRALGVAGRPSARS